MKTSWVWWSVLIVLPLATAGGLFSASSAQRRAEQELHMDLARIAASKYRWSAAETELQAALELDPASSTARALLADVEFRQGHVTEALGTIAQVPSRAPDGPAARLLEGTLLLTTGQAARAEAVLKECLAVDPRSIEARRRLVFLYGIELRRAELQRVLWELDDLHATDISELVLLSGSTFIVWNAAEIHGTVEEFAAADPHDVAARVAVGRYRLRQDDLEGARRSLEDACRLAPRDPEPHVALAECLIDEGEMVDAGRLLERIPPAWDRDPRFAFCRGRVAEEADRVEAAIQAYHRTIEADPDHREAHYRLGRLLRSRGRTAEAQTHLTLARRLADRESLLATLVNSGHQAQYAPRVARAEAELGHRRLARAWYAEAVRLDPRNEGLRREAARLDAGGPTHRGAEVPRTHED